jgi:hypothetical protein
MRAFKLLIATILLVLCPIGFAQGQAPGTNAEILKELRELRKAVDELTKKVDALGAKEKPQGAATEEEEEAAVAAQPRGETWTKRGPDLKALGEIKLPENPTKDQVKEYISRIAAASRNQNTCSPQDPQVNMLTRVGAENLDLLIEAAGGEWVASYYVIPAIVRLAREEDKKMILEALPYTHDLVKVVLNRGWEEDARETLLPQLRVAGYLPTEWVQAVANLRDPRTYDNLKNYLINGNNKYWTYGAIKDLPGIDLTEAVAEAWRYAKRERGYEAAYMAPVALEYGHKDALELIVNSLGKSDHDASYVREAEQLIVEYTDAGGSNEEIRKWFAANKDKLVFDPVTKKFRVQEGK